MKNSDMISVDDSDLSLNEPVSMSFAEHMDRVEAFADELNSVLRGRGFRICEACVMCSFRGEAILVRSTMTNGVGPAGPMPLSSSVCLPLPWTIKSDVEVSAESILNEQLADIDNGFLELCSEKKLLRIDFRSYAKSVTSVVHTVKPVPKSNGRGVIITP